MSPSRRHRAGFTLVEMLVAVALVVLMMVLFASVFQLATGAMSKQKGFAENDQKARLAQTLLKADLDKRTYRSVFAWKRKEDYLNLQAPLPPMPSLRQGYMYISENDPADDTDDVLQFTVSVSSQQKNKDTTPFYGRTVPLKHSSVTPSTMPPETMQQCVERYALNNPNQPELDDGQVNLDNTGMSTVAEVAYFLRNGTLYRRVMLVRTPYIGNQTTPYGYNSGGAIAELIDDEYRPDASNNPPAFAPTASGIFWRDFDYSAINLTAIDPGAMSQPDNEPTFLGAGASNYLDNSYTAAAIGTHVASLGMPNVRWGFSPTLASSLAGRPREYANKFKTTSSAAVQTGDVFMGRFTHAETSHADFLYPGTLDNGNPFSSTVDKTLIVDSGFILEHPTGPRRGEDILLTHVHAFDIKVYDDGLMSPDFVDLGNDKPAAQAGHYSRVRSLNTEFGPHPVGNVQNNVFDTWHPDFDQDNDAGTAMNPDDEQPPYRPWNKGPDGQWGDDGVNDDGQNGTDDIGEAGWPGSDDQAAPLKSIQIKLRYLDTTSNQMRDLTIIQSLTD